MIKRLLMLKVKTQRKNMEEEKRNSKIEKEEIKQNIQENIELEDTKIQTPEEQLNKEFKEAGIKIIYFENSISIINYNKKSAILLIKSEETREIKGQADNIKTESFDYIVVINLLKKSKEVKISKITIENQEILANSNYCKTVNEIYKLPMHETVLEKAKNLLAKV